MSFLVENWYIWFAFIVCLVCVVCLVYAFIKKPRPQQIEALKEWLKYAVAMAEKDLGSGTGQLKLRQVYDAFVTKFGWLAKLISFETFSKYVDDALRWLDGQLDNNESIYKIIVQDEAIKIETKTEG